MIGLFILPPIYAQNQLSVKDALKLAIENNYGVEISIKNIEVAEKNNSWGTAGASPKIDLTIGSQNAKDLGEYADKLSNTANATLGLQWLLFDGMRVQIRKNQFSILENISKGNAEVILATTFQDIVTAYYQILLNMKRLETAEYVMTLSKDRYDYQLKRQEIGVSVTYNVLQAKTAYLEDESNFLLSQINVNNAIRNLNFLIAVPADAKYNYSDDFNVIEQQYDIISLKKTMFKDNLNLKTKYLAQKLLQEKTNLSKSAYYPTLSLSSGARMNYAHIQDESANTTPFSSFETDYYTDYANLNFSYNLFNGGNNQRAIEIAKIDEEIGSIEIKEIRHSLLNRLYTFYDMYEVRKKMLAVAKETQEAAELNLSISKEKFESGAINSFNYRDVQKMYLNYTNQYYQAIYNLIDAELQLKIITNKTIN